MNEFTKEDLKLLAGCLFSKSLHILSDPTIKHLHCDVQILLQKIEAMIDNYCDHEWKSFVLPRGFESPGLYRCKICGEVKHDNQ